MPEDKKPPTAFKAEWAECKTEHRFRHVADTDDENQPFEYTICIRCGQYETEG